MLIAIEAERANIDHPTGVEHYAQQMIRKFAELDSKNKYILYLRTEPKDWIKNLPANFSYKVMPFPVAWTQLRLSWEQLIHPTDALFIMASSVPLYHVKNTTVTIHDLAWDKFPETFNWWIRFALSLFNWQVAHFTKKIIAISEQTKKDLIEKYRLPAEKISVIYHGFDLSQEVAQSDEEEKKKIAALPEKFAIYLSTLQPRKNPIRMIDAFLKLRGQGKISHSLVLVGGTGWLYDQILEKIAKHPEVIYMGYVQDRLSVLRKADLLIQPSLYEGFGMSLLDAFACNVPVACSNISSLPEVGGDAAEYFDPYSVDDMARAMEKVLVDRTWHDELVRRGAERLEKFTWDDTARKTLELIERK